jgi:hypothetical protein
VFEGGLAKALGPEEAHRLAMSDTVCMSNNGWGDGNKRYAK